MKAKALLCASVTSRDATATRTTEHNIVVDHTYAILRVMSNVAGIGISLVQLRNPWARDDWSGAWSDGSPEWLRYPEVWRALSKEVAGDATIKAFYRWEVGEGAEAE